MTVIQWRDIIIFTENLIYNFRSFLFIFLSSNKLKYVNVVDQQSLLQSGHFLCIQLDNHVLIQSI